MKRLAFAVFLLLGVLGNASFGAEIDRLDVRLYLNHSGTLSAPLDDRAELWNTIIGAGSAGEPSTSTLVVVVVSSKRGSFVKNGVVTLVVANARSGKVMSRMTGRLGVFSSDGKFHAPFLLKDTGCVRLRLTAKTNNSGESKTVTVPFQCGE
jgi:hypothetical protein